jgi:tubulysin polyketide synthase-like protein
MMALALLLELQRQGIKFIDEGGKLRVLTPKGVVLSDTLKNEIRQHKVEILNRLRSSGISAEDVLAVFPGAVIVDERTDLGVCARCHGNRWWVSRYGVKVCGHCFPPAQPELVVAWIGPRQEEKAA